MQAAGRPDANMNLQMADDGGAAAARTGAAGAPRRTKQQESASSPGSLPPISPAAGRDLQPTGC